jgi:hypothetical protein
MQDLSLDPAAPTAPDLAVGWSVAASVATEKLRKNYGKTTAHAWRSLHDTRGACTVHSFRIR